MESLLEGPLDDLLAAARERRKHGGLVTYSPKVFIPLTTLCRDVCGYCTFARPPRRGERAYLTEAEVLAIARAGAAAGCTEALFTLGDKPEQRYKVARAELAALGCETTLEYLGRVATLVLEETGLLPHLNPGVMSRDELIALRPVSASMGIMLETVSDRLSAQGRPALGLAGQGARPPPRDDRPGRRAADPVHERDPDRDRRDAGGADRGAGGTARAARAARPPAGGDRAELPRQARYPHGVASRAEPRRPSLDDRGGAAAAAGRRLRAGAAQPRLRRLSTPARRRHRRLGRRLARSRSTTSTPRRPGPTATGSQRPPARAASSSRPGCRSIPSSSPVGGSTRPCCRRR